MKTANYHHPPMQFVLVAGLISIFVTTVSVQAVEAERIFYLNEGEVCVGCIYKPAGKGPFPAVIFNQNVAKPLPEKGEINPFPELGEFYTKHRYILFSPGRRKAKDVDESLAAGRNKASERDEEGMFKFHQRQAETIYSAILTLKAQANVDPDQVYLTGYGAGASDSLLLAQKEIDVRGVIAFTPSFGANLILQNAVREAVKLSKLPIFLIQSENDPMLEPLVLSLKEKGFPNRSRIYPQGKKGLFALQGTEIWGEEVLKFFKATAR